MSATLVLEKREYVVEETEKKKTVTTSSQTCSCGLAHMASHNAMCPACSLKVAAQ